MQSRNRQIHPWYVPTKAEAGKFMELFKDEMQLLKIDLELFRAKGQIVLKILAMFSPWGLPEVRPRF
jgi:hypothetical protein